MSSRLASYEGELRPEELILLRGAGSSTRRLEYSLGTSVQEGKQGSLAELIGIHGVIERSAALGTQVGPGLPLALGLTLPLLKTAANDLITQLQTLGILTHGMLDPAGDFTDLAAVATSLVPISPVTTITVTISTTTREQQNHSHRHD
jgi:hypothetical protein